ncbi:MAG: hypothetical protein ACLS4Z_11170 [Christensenellaceae bacterium]
MTLPRASPTARDQALLYALAESSPRNREPGRARYGASSSERTHGGFYLSEKVPPTAPAGAAKAAYELFCRHCRFGTRVHMLGLSFRGSIIT